MRTDRSPFNFPVQQLKAVDETENSDPRQPGRITQASDPLWTPEGLIRYFFYVLNFVQRYGVLGAGPSSHRSLLEVGN